MEMSLSWWAGLLFPTAEVRVESVAVDGDEVRVRAVASAEGAACPGCGVRSARVHDRYVRRLAHSTVAGRAVAVDLLVRRFVCAGQGCPRRTFVEQVDGLTWRYGRRSRALRTVLERIALALAGRAGARLAVGLGMLISATTLLRLIRALPEPDLDHAPRVLGVDDFATRRGHVYATVLVDIEGHRVIDVLPDRTAETLAAWLDAHPGARIVCRDRASAYAEAVRTAAPDAQQVADRWHLWHNLCEAVEKCVLAHRDHLPEPVDVESPELEPDVGGPVPGEVEGALWVRGRERYAAVQDLVLKGVGISAISEALGLDRKTVRRFAHATCVEEVLTVHAARSRGTLRPYLGYLHQRCNEGCTDGAVLHAEIRNLGFRGSRRTVRRWLQPLRASGRPAPQVSGAPTVRQVTQWLHRDGLAVVAVDVGDVLDVGQTSLGRRRRAWASDRQDPPQRAGRTQELVSEPPPGVCFLRRRGGFVDDYSTGERHASRAGRQVLDHRDPVVVGVGDRPSDVVVPEVRVGVSGGLEAVGGAVGWRVRADCCQRAGSVKGVDVKRLAMTAVAVATAVLGPLAPLDAAAAAPSVLSPGPAQAASQRQYYPDVDYITCEINQERANHGLPALLISDRVNDVARAHAKDMADMRRLTSTGSDGRNQRDRLNDAGFFSSYISAFVFSGYSHDGYFADMATDPRPDNGFYQALMSRDVVAVGLGYDRTFWDVNLLGHHRRLNARPAVCAQA